MMDTSVSAPIPNKPKDVSEDKCTEDQNNKEISDKSCNTPVSDIEAPLSPVLTNSKKSLRHIARRKSRIKLLSKFSQNSLASQETCTPLEQSQVEENELSTDGLKIFVETSALSTDSLQKEHYGDNELEERLKRCLELQRNKKFCYKIAINSSKILKNSKSNDSNFKILESPENISEIDNLKSIEPFVSNINITDCKTESDFNFKIPESPVSLSKSKKSNNIKVKTDSATNSERNINLNIGFETGSGKKINLSEKAIKRAAKLFDDIIDTPEQSEVLSNYEKLEDIKIETSFNKNKNHDNKGFKISGGNSSKLSGNSAKNAQSLFDDILDLSNESQNETNSANVEVKQKSNKKLQNVDETKSATNTETKNPTQFKTPPQQIENKLIYKPNQGLSPENKTFSFTQITDTQMYSAAENAECLSEFILNTQWTPSPKDKSQDPKIQLSNEKKISKSQDDEFVSPETDQFFGNLTVCEDGTIATRNNESNETDSGKKVTITEESISKAENISVDCDFVEENIDKNSEIRFFTASGKKVTISEESLIKARNIFEDDDFVEENFKKYSAPEKMTTDKNDISEESLKKTKNMFDDFDFIEENTDKNIYSEKTAVGFSTASGKKLSISKESLKKVENIFQDCDITPDITEENMQKNSFAEIMTAGFSTASGKKVSISEESLKKAKSIFQDCDNVEENTEKNIVSDLMTAGFSTASGKKVSISEESLKKAKNIFQDCDIVVENTDKNIVPELMTAGFSTASGKKLSISEESLKKAENIFQDCDNVKENTEKNIVSDLMTAGFSTASGKKVSISEESLKKVKNIFQDCDIVVENTDKNIVPELMTAVFSTASGKKVSISEESLKKAKNIFQDCDIVEENTEKKCAPENLIAGFSSASDKKVSPSKESLKNVENMFENCIIEESSENNLTTQVKPIISEDTIEINYEISAQLSTIQPLKEEHIAETSMQSGFLTASGKKVVMSEEVLNKVRNIFEDPSDLNKEIPEEEMFEFATPFENITILEESIKDSNNLEVNESNEPYQQNCTSSPKKDTTCNFCGFTWDESLISYKIYERYKRSFTCIEKYMRENVFHPFLFTFDTIQSSKEYKNKNYKNALRFRKKSSVIYGYSKSKSARKSVKNSPKTPELLNTSNIVTRSKSNLTIEDTSPSLIANNLSTNRSRKRKSDSNNRNISSASIKSDSDNKSLINIDKNININKTIEDMEEAFLCYIENNLKETTKNSQETNTTDSFLSTEEINSSKENFASELSFNTPPNINENNINPEAEKSIKVVQKDKIDVNNFENMIKVKEEIVEKTKHIFDKTNEDLKNNIAQNVTPKNSNKSVFISESNKDNILDTSSETKNKVDINNFKKSRSVFEACDVAQNESNINLSTPSIENKLAVLNSVIEENIETPKNESNFGFATASGKNVTISEDALKKVKNIFQDCDVNEEYLNKNTETPKNTTAIGFVTASGKKVTISEDALQKAKCIFQDCDVTEEIPDNTFETPKNTATFGFATASGKKVSISEDALKKARNIFQDCDITEEIVDENVEMPDNMSSFEFATDSGNIEENVNKNIDTIKNVSSFGFATASGKQVSISEDALKKAKNIFQDCDMTEENVDKNIGTPKNASSFGFATASGKKVAISEDALKKAKNLFQDCDMIEENVDKNIETPKNALSFGFATASGKKVAISEDALKKAKNLFQDCDIIEKNVDKNIETPKNALSFGFATASGKKVAISEDALKKAKNLFQDCDIIEENVDKNIETPKNALSFGFATASGKKVAISEDALKKAKNLFQDCDMIKENVDKNIETPKNALSFGFATASGKKVGISEDALKKAKNLFQDCDMTEENVDKNIGTPKNALSLGFATASGKKVAISEDALKKAKNLFQDCDMIEENVDKNIETPKNASSFGFATASGKKVGISEDALKKAKNLFQDCDMTKENVDKNIETPKYVSSFGFATASGKKVAISEDALQKAKNIFQDCDIDKENIDTNLDTPKHVSSFGFATASGRQVAVSEDALKKAKNLFQDCDIAEENIDTPKTKSSFGFDTASGKKVAVSEEAIEKAKTMFEEIRETNISTPKTSLIDEFSSASGEKITISETGLKRARNIFEDVQTRITKEDLKNESTTTLISEMPFKKMRSISESEENRSTINTPKQSYSSPQILPNDSTPILRKKTLSIRNSKKRSLGVTPCKQIDIPENSLKRAKLVFDDVETPKKKETTINNNNLQSYSPFSNKTNSPVVKTPLNFVSKSTPTISTQNMSLLNSNISMKESNQIKSSQNLVTPKISPLKRLCIGNENIDENLSFVFQERTVGDIKKWNTDLHKELEMLKLKMSVVETRMMMLNELQEIIETGSSDHRRQRPGSLFTQKSNNNRLTLKEAVNNRRPEKNTHQICLKIGLDPSLLEITSENSSNLHFHVPWWTNDNRTYPAVIRTEDGAVVIPNQQNYVGITELERAFLAMPGIDPSLVPKKWVSNHYRWIVWKLASLERNFSDVFKNCLSVESVMSQIKYRYDREIDRAQRPAIRKIVECDDTAAKRMVLCVATVIKLPENKYELELTDGWYSIKTMLDIPLNNLVQRNVIKNGMKLITQGAELLNCEGCCPLELPANVRLQIHYNSTRRAAWHAKLGYQPNPGPLRISLRMISGNGGPIGAVSGYVARLYPISFMERCDAAITWRNKRAELRRANQWEASYTNMMETIQMSVQEELEKEWTERERKNKNKRVKIKDVNGVNCGRTLYQFIEDSNDPDTVKELLTTDQISALQDYQTELNIERQSELTTRLRQKLSSDKIKPRNVSTVLKLLLVDVHSPYHHRMLSVWRPTETHTQLLKEGIVINIYNVTAKNNGTLSSIPRTQFDINCNIDTTKFENTNRFVIPISQISNPSLKPEFGEFDTVGMVVTIDVRPTAQTLWLADETYRFLMVKIREGPETCSLFDAISPGKIVAAMNLIHQKPFKFYGEAVGNHYTVLSSYPQQPYLQDFMQEFIENLSEQTENIDQYLEECKNRIEEISSQNLKRGYVLNPLNVNHSEEETESLTKKLCGVESTQPNKSDSLTLSDEEMALIDTQVM